MEPCAGKEPERPRVALALAVAQVELKTARPFRLVTELAEVLAEGGSQNSNRYTT